MADAGKESVVIDVADLEPGQTRALELLGREVLLCNVDGELYAVENLCTHTQVPLTDGRLLGFTLECPLHGARFDVRDGSVTRPPAYCALPSFRVQRQGTQAEIELPEEE